MSKNINFQNLSIDEQVKLAFSSEPDIGGRFVGVRKIKQGSVNKRTSLFSSKKNGGMISLESNLELAYALELERNIKVQYYRTQAVKITLNEFQSVYPDFLIKYDNGSIEVHEVKPNKLYLRPDDIESYQQVENILDHLNINFKIIDRLDLFITNEYELLTTLYFYHRNKTLSWPNFQIQEALEVISKLNAKVLNEIYEGLDKNNLPRELGDYLIFYRYIPTPSFVGSRRSIKNRKLL